MRALPRGVVTVAVVTWLALVAGCAAGGAPVADDGDGPAAIDARPGGVDGAVADGAIADGAIADGPGADAAPPPLDAAPPPDAPAPQCTTDAQCGAGRGCLAGTCRDQCLFGFYCGAASSGSICRSGLCVQCGGDADCRSGRRRCDAPSATCVPRPFDPSRARFGIFYSTWHCIAANASPVRDLTLVRAGQQGWGGFGVFHYWGRPAPGYYCPSANDGVLRQHAELLRDAGIDFAFLDATNHAYVDARSHDTPGMILAPLDRLLAVWSTVPGAPRLVPWVPVMGATASATTYTVDAMLARLAAYPGMQFVYQGKPLVLVTENEQYPVNATREAALAQSYTVRRMWAMFGDAGPTWSFLQACQASPTSAEPCAQRAAVSGGSREQIPVSVAYQATFMNVATATPKHRGLTFRKQFQQALDWPETPIITITGWNEWIAQRQPCGHAACPCATYPDGCFIDQWDVEYSRDIEPGANEMGDYYYRLMKACVSLFRTGGECDAAHQGDLCCRAWTP